MEPTSCAAGLSGKDEDDDEDDGMVLGRDDYDPIVARPPHVEMN